MKILIAPDSFKGTLRAGEVCRIWREALSAELPDAELVLLPMADGGEGSLEAVVEATGATLHQVNTVDPLGRPIRASYAKLNENSAFIETAAACGLELLSPEERNPIRTSTYGAGILLREALLHGAREVTLGIGGSATVDGGLGLLQALGYRFLDNSAKEVTSTGAALKDIASCDASSVLPELKSAKIRIASDVRNPLLGTNGAATVYGPQKGATPEMVKELETGLANYASVLLRAGLADCSNAPGDGAAGGMGFALRAVLHGVSSSGARLLAELARLEEHLKGASLLITGEGRSDSQTLQGKLPFVLAEIASAHGVPTLLCSGTIEAPQCLASYFTAIFSTLSSLQPLPEVLLHARENLSTTARAIAAAIRIGRLAEWEK